MVGTTVLNRASNGSPGRFSFGVTHPCFFVGFYSSLSRASSSSSLSSGSSLSSSLSSGSSSSSWLDMVVHHCYRYCTFYKLNINIIIVAIIESRNTIWFIIGIRFVTSVSCLGWFQGQPIQTTVGIFVSYWWFEWRRDSLGMDDSSEEEPTQESLVVSHCSLWRNNNRTQHPLFCVPFGHTEKYPTRVIILGVLDFHGVLCPITHENCNCAAIQKYIRSRPLRTRKKTLENLNRKSIMGYVFVCYPEKGSCIFARSCKEFSETPPEWRFLPHS